jgi:hypothetical protein
METEIRSTKKTGIVSPTISFIKTKINKCLVVDKVLSDHSYIVYMKKLSGSFKKAGNYLKAVEEISKLKKEKRYYLRKGYY